MQTEKKPTTIKTNLFNNFIWKRFPVEHDYITILFCLDSYKNLDNSDDFMKYIENDEIKKAITYILNIMPYKCIININDYLNYKFYKDNLDDNKELDFIIKKIDNLKNNLSKINSDIQEDTNSLKERIKKIENKKTFIFSCNTKEIVNDFKNESLSKMLDISLNLDFNTHKLYIGEIENISKYNLTIADYIFFENKNVLNKYLELQNHNIRIKESDSSLYLLDKCNYEYYQLFNFEKHLDINFNE